MPERYGRGGGPDQRNPPVPFAAFAETTLRYSFTNGELARGGPLTPALLRLDRCSIRSGKASEFQNLCAEERTMNRRASAL